MSVCVSKECVFVWRRNACLCAGGTHIPSTTTFTHKLKYEESLRGAGRNMCACRAQTDVCVFVCRRHTYSIHDNTQYVRVPRTNRRMRVCVPEAHIFHSRQHSHAN